MTGRLGTAVLLAAAILLALPAAVCAQQPEVYPPDPKYPQAQVFPFPPTSPDTVGMDWSQEPEYRIVPGDLLRLNFGPRIMEPDEDLIREVKVRPDGRMQVFPIGDVVAAGRTVAELQKALLEMLSAEYVNPRVTIDLAELAGNQVHVFGRVKKPGSYPVGPFCTLTQAVSMAGGFEDDAHTNDILVYHRNGLNTVAVFRVPMGKALRSGSPQADLPLSRFDIVYVPRNAIGRWDVFSKKLFEGLNLAFASGIRGWELFHLDEIYFGYRRTGTTVPNP